MKFLFLVSIFVIVQSNNRVTRQIKFGVHSAADVPRKFNTTRVTTNNGISFASSSVKEDNVVLKDLLKMDTAGSLSARFGFTGSVTRLGQSCETPLRESGSCQYIGADQCRPVLSAIIKHGVTKAGTVPSSYYILNLCYSVIHNTKIITIVKVMGYL